MRQARPRCPPRCLPGHVSASLYSTLVNVRTEGMLKLIRTNVANHTLTFFISSQDGKTTISVSSVDQAQQLIPEALHRVSIFDTDHDRVAVCLSKFRCQLGLLISCVRLTTSFISWLPKAYSCLASRYGSCASLDKESSRYQKSGKHVERMALTQ